MKTYNFTFWLQFERVFCDFYFEWVHMYCIQWRTQRREGVRTPLPNKILCMLLISMYIYIQGWGEGVRPPQKFCVLYWLYKFFISFLTKWDLYKQTDNVITPFGSIKINLFYFNVWNIILQWTFYPNRSFVYIHIKIYR